MHEDGENSREFKRQVRAGNYRMKNFFKVFSGSN